MSFESLLAAPLSVKRGQAGIGAVGFDIESSRRAASAKRLGTPTAETVAAFCELVFSAQSPGLHIVYTRWTPLSEFDYLVATGNTRVGALAFGPDLSGPRRVVPWSEENLDGEDLDLKGMLEAVQDVDTADDLPRKHGRFLSRGSSLGGARPKATTEYSGKQWIAKFGRADDHWPMCRAEYATMKLAQVRHKRATCAH